jgi:hypothetical protein
LKHVETHLRIRAQLLLAWQMQLAQQLSEFLVEVDLPNRQALVSIFEADMENRLLSQITT